MPGATSSDALVPFVAPFAGRSFRPVLSARDWANEGCLTQSSPSLDVIVVLRRREEEAAPAVRKDSALKELKICATSLLDKPKRKLLRPQTSASLLGTGASLLVTSALLVVTMFATRNKCIPTSNKKLLRPHKSHKTPKRTTGGDHSLCPWLHRWRPSLLETAILLGARSY